MSEAFAASLASSMESCARHFWKDPNPALSSKTELRWGNHGSLSVDLEKGVWHDHEEGKGGGVLDLVARETGRKGKEAVTYLKDALGFVVEDDHANENTRPAPRKVVATYDYTQADGSLVFQVIRYEPKDFRQRRPDPSARDGWNWSTKGITQVPYRLPDLFSLEGRGAVYVVEGEKDADYLASLGLVATCNAGGAGKWPGDLAPYFDGLDVVIVPDNDDAGRKHADIVGASLREYTASVRVLNLPDLPPKGDVSDWFARGGSRERLEALGQSAPLWTPEPPQSAFGAIQWADLDSVGIRQDWLVEDFLFEGDSALIFGASGSGKSFLSVDMGLSIARGVPFLGKATSQGAVLYQAGEGGKGLVKRLRAYRQHHAVTGDVPFVLLPSRVNLFAEDGDGQTLIQECIAWKAVYPCLKAIFIDTLSTASPGANENSSEDMSILLEFADQLQRQVGISVIWVHHKNASGERERGHTSLRANADTAIEVNRDEEDNRTLKLVKIKDGEDGEKIGFALQSVGIGTYDSGKPMTSCVVVPAQVGDPRTGDAWRMLAPGQHLFMMCLEDAVAQRGGIVPPGVGAGRNAYGVDWSHFREIYKHVRGAGMEDNAIRQAIKREGEALVAKGYVGRGGDWLWVTNTGGEYLTRFSK